MVVDFSKLNFKERQTLILKNLDGTYLQPLVFANKMQAKLYYNEVSEITFEIPAFVDGIKTPCYDDIVGMRIIDWYGVGQFILVNPSISNDGICEIKSCKAYSLEYELTYKTLYLEDGTYNFWNPVDSKNTFLGRLLEVVPSWSVGSVDASLIGKYRTFGVDNNNAYQAAKDLQETYQCIFDFDTYNRKINVRAVSDLVDVKPIYLSMENLIKEIQIEEDTENIFTCLDVNGADGVDIRGVNPLGTNKIYNLDYFMNTTYFTQELIDKWYTWKSTYNDCQSSYFNTTVEKVLKESQLETESAALTELKNELSSLETLQSLYVEAAAQGIDRSEQLADVKSDISEKKAEITRAEGLLSSIETEISNLLDKQKEINSKCDLWSYFNDQEAELLNRYIKETSITENSFVYQQVSSYVDEDISALSQSVDVSISGSTISGSDGDAGILYSCIGGAITLTVDEKVISAPVMRAAVEQHEDGTGLFTAYLDSGSYGEESFAAGCISLSGSLDITSTDVSRNDEIGGQYVEGHSISATFNSANLYFTKGATEYAKRSVEWDLFAFGLQNLEELSWPTYTFSVDSANFLALDDFLVFKNQLALGTKAYLNLRQGILTPIVIGVEVGFEDPSDFKIVFGDKYSLNDSAFKLVDLLDQSVSMGKTVASNLKKFNAFIESGASTELKDYINSALDASKQAILAGAGQSAQLDGSGFRLRKWNDSTMDYDPEQIWMINNNIVFTDNNWDTAKMALGHIINEDENIDAWGLVADLIVGKLLAGENLVIESMQADGTAVAFRVDASGAQLHNARFDLIEGNGQITLYPETGLVGGVSTTAAPMFHYDENGNIDGVMTTSGDYLSNLTYLDFEDLPRANFWVDMEGNAYFKGTVYATDGQFSGTVYATDGEFHGVVKASDFQIPSGSGYVSILQDNGKLDGEYVDLMGINIINSNGDTVLSINEDGIEFMGDAGLSESEVQDMIDSSIPKVPDVESILRGSYKITHTALNYATIESPTIIGNDMKVYNTFQALNDDGETVGYFGAAEGRDANGDTTYGAAVTSQDQASYVLLTNAGVKLSAGSKPFVSVTDTSVTLGYGIAWSGSVWYPTVGIRVENGGCYYTTGGNSWIKIGSGSGGSATAVFG